MDRRQIISQNDKLIYSCKVVALIDLSIILCIIIISSIYFGQVNKTELLKLGLFMLFYVQIPGLLSLGLLGIKFKIQVTKYPIGFFIGFALITIIYIISVQLNQTFILNMYSIITCMLFFVIKIMKVSRCSDFRKRQNHLIKDINLVLYISLIIIFLISMLYTQGTYPDFKSTGYVFLYPDNAWHMGIVNAVAQGFPPEMPWYYNAGELNYHYFTDFLYGIALKTLDVPADVSILTGTPYLITYLYGLSAYSVIYEMNEKKYFAGMFPFISIFGVLWGGHNYELHVLKNVNNVGFAAAVLMCLFILLKSCMENNSRKHCISTILAMALLMYLLTGLKGPFGLVFIVGAMGTLLFSMFFKSKDKVKYLAITVTLLIVFVVTYYSFIAGTSATSTTLISIKGLIYDIKSFKFILIFGVFFVPFFVFFVQEAIGLAKKTSSFNFITITFFAITIAGLTAKAITEMPDGNNGYFGYASVPSLAILGTVYLSERWNRKETYIRIMKFLTIVLVIISLANFTLTFLEVSKVTERSLNIAKIDKKVTRGWQGYFSYQEYKAMKWIRENTPQNALIASDKQALVPKQEFNIFDKKQQKWFYYSGYSQRRFFLEGTAYVSLTDYERNHLYKMNSELYSMNNSLRVVQAKALGINYFIVSKRLNPNFKFADKGIERCFSNKDVDIYKVK
ncbi:MAG: hypothetical protein SOR93_07410 [Clostridiales Family XIII bacterium]|nr:hypothetical protein [Clostridia bacterium]MDE8733860.1 hypothetical protein [Eubacteriales bacterium DFI.9.88]MDY3011066.1 hypothetical protein [Clostridiales Family XIII bacterium]